MKAKKHIGDYKTGGFEVCRHCGAQRYWGLRGKGAWYLNKQATPYCKL